MQVQTTNIEGVLILTPQVFGDSRGYFLESFNRDNFDDAIGNSEFEFVQDNESMSSKGVLRGLHYQSPPYDQGKLVRVIQGEVLDVVVDIRQDSITYGQYFSITLNGTSKQMLWIPPGMAHGFASLENNTIFAYKCTEFYRPESEGCILWNDPDLSIIWGVQEPIISDKDKRGVLFRDFVTPFTS
ncbi:MAG: dTDP-4-dehydrorhamnose 3,5-epimerase [Flavobacteriales bacterium]|nr:dTDP-4-dehydrorhamnose 3,5-epimerase [Flavobacteriales bacterium]